MAVVDRPGAEQRAEAERDAAVEGADGPGLQAFPAALEAERRRRRERDDDQEDGGLEEREVGAVVVDADVRDGQAAGDERGQERAQPRGARDARALEDVEEQSHGSATVATIDFVDR